MWKLTYMKGKRVLITLYLSFVVIFIFPIAIMTILTKYSFIKTVEKDQNLSNLNALQQSREILDYNFKYINSMAYQLSLSPTILSFAQETPMSESEKTIKIKNIINELSIYNVSKDIFCLTAIYVKSRDMVITPFTAYTSREFYEQVANYEGMSYEEWFYRLNDIRYQTFWANHTINGEAMPHKEVTTILTPLPLGYEKPLLSFIGFIDTNRIISIFNDSFSNKEGEIVISDNKNNRLICSANQNLDVSPSGNSFASENGVFDTQLDGVSYVGVYASSKVVNIRYMYLIPHSVFTGIADNLQKSFAVTVVICLAVGLLAVLFLSSRNYRPLGNLVRYLETKNLAAQGKSEYDVIQNSFQKITNDYQCLENKVELQMIQVVHNFFGRLLKTSDIEDAECREYLDSYKIDFSKKYLAALVISIDSFQDFSPEESISDKQSAVFAVMNITEELLGACFTVYTVDVHSELLALIVNFEEDTGLYDRLLEIKNTLGNAVGIYVSMGLGSSCEQPSKLHASYTSAMTALNYAKLTSFNSVTVFKDIEPSFEAMFYPIEREMQLIASIKDGNESQALRILREIFKVNFTDSTISPLMAECLFYNVGSTLMKTLSDLNRMESPVYLRCTDLMKRLSTPTSATVFFESCEEIVRDTCRQINTERKLSSDSLISSVCAFIDHNYQVQTLSLEYAADYFDITYTYLSKIFKEYTGYNFIDYLNRLRLSKSKEILCGTQNSIQDIAEQVGYSSSNTYIRIFKKYHGITPGQYRAKQERLNG